MTLPTKQTGASIPSYRHMHQHTGTTSATAIDPPAKAFIVVNQSATVTLETDVGSEAFGSGNLPTGVVIPCVVNSITLGSTNDDVLLLF